MSAWYPEDPPAETPDAAVVARMLARDHAASLATVARQRLWLLDALARGVPITELANDLNVTPRAIRHLLGPVDR